LFESEKLPIEPAIFHAQLLEFSLTRICEDTRKPCSTAYGVNTALGADKHGTCEVPNEAHADQLTKSSAEIATVFLSVLVQVCY